MDIIILILLAIGAYNGYHQGFFISILSIIAFILAIIFAFHFMDWGAGMLAERVDEMTYMLPFIAFIIIFLVVIVVIKTLGLLVKKTIDFTLLGSVDNLAGAILGILKMGFLLSLMLWIADSFEFSLTESWTKESRLYSFLQPIAPMVIQFMDQYTPIVKNTIESIHAIVKSASNAVVD